MREATLQSLVGRLYDAALHEELWPTFLAELAAALRGELPGMIPLHTKRGVPLETIAVDCDPGFLHSFDAYYGRILLELTDCVPPNGLHTLEELAPAPFERWEFYADWMRPLGQRHYLGQMTSRSDGLLASFGVYREARARPFGREDAELMRALAPHFARAVQLRDRFAALRAERDVASAALERLSVGILLFDPSGTLLAVNPVAERIAEAADGLRIGPAGLSLSHRPSDQTLRRLLKEAAQTARGEGTGPGGGALAVPRPSGRRPYELLVTPLPRDGLTLGRRRAAVTIFLTDPEREPQASAQVLRQLYGLTPAEARLAVELARGTPLEAAADGLGITRGTARNQLAQVFAKTDTHRQADLVRRLLAGSARLGGREP